MAFVTPTEETPAAQGQAASQQAPIAAGGQGIGGSTKAAAAPGVNVPAQPSAQLSAYLSANQPQAAAFGQNLAGQVAGQINAAGQAIQPAVNTYTGGLYSVAPDASVNAAVASSPSSLTPEQQATYRTELGAAGAAPNSSATFETTPGYQDAAGKVQSAVDQANLWNSGNNPSNISTALAPYEGPNATTGVRTLDSLLLSQTPDAYKAIQSAVAPAAGYQDQLASGTQSADAALQVAISQDLATTPAAMGAAQTYAGNLNSTLAQYLAAAQGKVKDYNAQVNPLAQNLANVQPDIAALQNAIDAYNAILKAGPGSAGVPYDAGPTFSPIEYGQVGQIPNVLGMPDTAQLATSGQYSDLAALRDLLGDSAFGSLNTSVSPDQASLAGSWTPANNANIPNLSMLVDPLTSKAIQSLMPNVTAMQQFAPAVQASAPLGSDLRAIQAALDKLEGAISGQTSGTPTPPPPPQNAVPPQNGQPGNEAWFNYIQSAYPGLDGFPATYQDYLNQFNSGGGGIRPI
jgi:hypothetical protein